MMLDSLSYKTKQFFVVLIKLSIVVGAFYFIYLKLTENETLDFRVFIDFPCVFHSENALACAINPEFFSSGFIPHQMLIGQQRSPKVTAVKFSGAGSIWWRRKVAHIFFFNIRDPDGRNIEYIKKFIENDQTIFES